MHTQSLDQTCQGQERPTLPGILEDDSGGAKMIIEQTLVETKSGKITTTRQGINAAGVIETVTIVLETQGDNRVSGELMPARYSIHEQFHTRHHSCELDDLCQSNPTVARHYPQINMTLAEAVEEYQDRIRGWRDGSRPSPLTMPGRRSA